MRSLMQNCSINRYWTLSIYAFVNFDIKNTLLLTGTKVLLAQKWGPEGLLKPSKQNCAVMKKTDGYLWWQPENCYNKHAFKCVSGELQSFDYN